MYKYRYAITAGIIDIVLIIILFVILNSTSSRAPLALTLPPPTTTAVFVASSTPKPILCDSILSKNKCVVTDGCAWTSPESDAVLRDVASTSISAGLAKLQGNFGAISASSSKGACISQAWPDAPAPVYPVQGAEITTLQPTLQWFENQPAITNQTKFPSPSPAPISATMVFRWFVKDAATNRLVWSRDFTTAEGDAKCRDKKSNLWFCTAVQIPAGKLKVGKTYRWVVQSATLAGIVGNTGLSPFSAQQQFTVVDPKRKIIPPPIPAPKTNAVGNNFFVAATSAPSTGVNSGNNSPAAPAPTYYFNVTLPEKQQDVPPSQPTPGRLGDRCSDQAACERGLRCDREGRCVAETPGNTPCAIDDECGGLGRDYRCRDNVCVIIPFVSADPCTQVQCAPGEVCQNGACVGSSPTVPGSCSLNGDCPTGKLCKSGQCEVPNQLGDRCDNTVGCEGGLTCSQGVCENVGSNPPAPYDPCAAILCGTGKTCQNGACVDNPAAGSGSAVDCSSGQPCPAGYACDYMTGNCTLAP